MPTWADPVIDTSRGMGWAGQGRPGVAVAAHQVACGCQSRANFHTIIIIG
jgi:hypothetical protein